LFILTIYSNISKRVNIDKAITIIASVLIFFSTIIIAITPPATGYEISLYGAYPGYFWVLVISSMSCGILILVHQAFTKQSSRWWIGGFVSILVINLVILLLPIVRGYLTWGNADVLTHIGMIKDILFTGHFASIGQMGENFYPAIHILCAEISLLTGLTPELLAELIPILFTIFYMVSICLLARQVGSSRGQILLITAFGSLLLFNHENLMLSPSVECFFLFPMTLFLFVKTLSSAQRPQYTMLFSIILLLTPFIHPGDGSMFLILAFMCFCVSLWLYNKIGEIRLINGFKNGIPQSSWILFTPILILLLTWFVWFSSFSVFNGSIRQIWEALKGLNITTAESYSNILSKANMSLFQFGYLFFKMWGNAAIYILIGGIISIGLFVNLVSHNIRVKPYQLIFTFLFVVFFAILVVVFFTNVLNVAYNREIKYVIFSATILSGLTLYSIFADWHKTLGVFLISAILIIGATIGLFNTFPSPIVRESNSQVTNTDMTGMAWFLSHRNESLLIEEGGGIDQDRFADAIYGTSSNHYNIRYNPILPDHFGYPDNNTFGDSYTQDTYLIENKLSIIIYPDIFPDFTTLWRFTPEDFQRLDTSDPTVDTIFTSNEFWVYYVHGTGIEAP
jgi:hypothetical protein